MPNPLTMSCLHPATIRFRRFFFWLFLELKQLLVAMKVALAILLENYAPVSVCFPIQLYTESHVDVLAPLPGEDLLTIPYNRLQPAFFACLNNRCWQQPSLCAIGSVPLRPENVAYPPRHHIILLPLYCTAQVNSSSHINVPSDVIAIAKASHWSFRTRTILVKQLSQ